MGKMNVLPDILYELKQFHQQYYDDFDDGLRDDREFFDMLRDEEDIYIQMFLDRFRDDHWFKYTEIEDLAVYDVATVIHVIQHVKNTTVMPNNIIDCFNCYRYQLIETMLLENLDTVMDSYLDYLYE